MIEVQTPEVRIRVFRNLDSALDYCKTFQPKKLVIQPLLDQVDGQGNQQQLWQLEYISGEEQ